MGSDRESRKRAWEENELSSLAKAIVKFPAGSQNRELACCGGWGGGCCVSTVLFLAGSCMCCGMLLRVYGARCLVLYILSGFVVGLVSFCYSTRLGSRHILFTLHSVVSVRKPFEFTERSRQDGCVSTRLFWRSTCNASILGFNFWSIQ